MIQTLRKKFILITMTLVSVVLLSVFVGISLYYASSIRKENFATLEKHLGRTHNEKDPNFKPGGQVPDGFSRNPIFVVEIDSTGAPAIILADGIDVNEEELDGIVQSVLASEKFRGELDKYDLLYLRDEKGPQTKIVFMTLSLEHLQFRNFVLISGIGILGALIILFLASALLSRWALRPVEETWQKQRRFITDASHELKTPLTVILANTSILKKHKNETIGDQITWVEGAGEEAHRMKGLVDDMLFLARGDDVASDIPMEIMDLSDALATMTLSMEPIAFEEKLSLEMEIEPGVMILGNEPQIRQLVAILLDNAIKYSEQESTVTVALMKRQSLAELSIHNIGDPVGQEAQEHIFDRFYRADLSRAKEGYGLGLSIAKAITENHGGKIKVSSEENSTVFTLSFPVAKK